MKKLLICILALAMCCAMSVPAFAADTIVTPGDNGNPNPSSGNTTVSFNVNPTYTVTIPATVEMDKVERDVITYEKDMAITAAGARLLKGQSIQVTLKSDFELTSEGDITLPYTVTVNNNSIDAENNVVATFTTSESEQISTLHFAANDPEYAGDYSDTVTFTLSVVNG